MTSFKLPPPTTEPFFCKGTRGSVLLLHGYTGTPYEVLPLALALEKRGFACSAPRLPGHGTFPLELNKVSYQDWLDEAERALEQLPPHQPTFIFGFSMGGLLACLVAQRALEKKHYLLKGLILLAPAFALHTAGIIGTYLASLGLHYLLPMVSKKGGSDIGCPEGKRLNPSYAHIPVKGLIELEKLRKKAMTAAQQTQLPTWVGVAAQDQTVHSDRVLKIAARLLPQATSVNFSHSHHIMLLDSEKDSIIKAIQEFCESHA